MVALQEATMDLAAVMAVHHQVDMAARAVVMDHHLVQARAMVALPTEAQAETGVQMIAARVTATEVAAMVVLHKAATVARPAAMAQVHHKVATVHHQAVMVLLRAAVMATRAQVATMAPCKVAEVPALQVQVHPEQTIAIRVAMAILTVMVLWATVHPEA